MTTEATRLADNNQCAAHRVLGRMTPTERRAGRFLRSPDEHPPAVAEPAPVEGGPAEAVVTGAETPPAAAPAAATTHVRPEGLPDEFWDDATGVKAGDVWSALRDLRAEQAERAADLPGEGEAYDLALPADLKLPDGVEVVIDKEDPLWADFQSIAREAGVSKGKFTEFVGAFAKYQAAAHEAQVNEYVAEMGKLGANATARRDAASNWLKANLTTAQVEALGSALITADGVAAIEAITKLKSGPVAATGVGAAAASTQFEGLHGASRLEAIRAQQAAAV